MSDGTSGGFFRSNLSPPSSSHASSSAATVSLPHSRDQPLKPGGSKESAFIRIVDQSLLKIQRRYAKRGEDVLEQQSDSPDTLGYRNFADAARDIKKVVDLIWISGTRKPSYFIYDFGNEVQLTRASASLQIPYLLNIAMLVEQYISDLAPSPRAIFRILGELDLAFASLLQGRHIETNEPLPGFEHGSAISSTEKVRMKSIVDRTRVCVVDVIGNFEGDDEWDDVEQMDDGDELDSEDDVEEDIDDVGEHEMKIAKVYEKTISLLGDTVGGTPIGIITED